MGLDHHNNEELRWTSRQQHKKEELAKQPQRHHLMLTDQLIQLDAELRFSGPSEGSESSKM